MNTYRAYGRNVTTWFTVERWLIKGEAFSNSTKTFYGMPLKLDTAQFQVQGRLDGAMLRRLRDMAPRVDYMVYSYGTPIAWHTAEDGWTVHGDVYSQTTTQHSRVIELAVHDMSDDQAHAQLPAA